MTADAPIGVFDSGLGGLSVAAEIRALLPGESILYYGDTANCPYGGRDLEEIRSLTLRAGQELADRGAKVIVVACNTASGAALETLREALTIPIVGLEPAIKPAARITRTGAIGVMATEATLRTERFQRLARDHAAHIHLIPQPCPGLVEFVEAGEVSGPRVAAALEQIVAPLRASNVGAVVLGCTHYPFLRDAIQEALGPDVVIVDSGRAVARQVRRVLEGRGDVARGEGSVHILTTGDPARVSQVVERLWPVAIDGYSQVSNLGGPPSAGSAA